MDTLSVFHEKFEEIIKSDLRKVLLESNEENVEELSHNSWESQNQNNMSCSYCRVDFPNSSTQREHYKLDWHRFNLKQSLQGKGPITEQDFNVKNGNDDISSISGSDSENEDTLDTFAIAQGKIFLQNKNGQIFSVFKCLVFNKKDEVNEDALSKKLKYCCLNNKQWMVIMLGGGHFAAAIFKDGKPILHKTFHCYTVRQGQGGSQSSRDNKSGGSHPKSAGSSLRRYNEQALIQHVQDIVKQWQNEIAESSLIFYRAPGPYNRSVLFGGPSPIFSRSDERLRTIPFSTRRATYTEVQRVFGQLSNINLYQNLDMAIQHLNKHRNQCQESKKKQIRSSQINRAKSRESLERPLPTKHSSETNSLADSDSEEDQIIDTTLDSSELVIDFGNLKEFECTEKKVKKKKPKKSKNRKLKEKEAAKKMELIKLLSMGNQIKLKEILEDVGKNLEGDQLSVQEYLRLNFVNEVLDEEGNSFLHIAAMNEHSELVVYFLENGSDPCLKNNKLQTPYCATSSREVRDAMKKFASENPDKHNYNKAQIPMVTLTPEEIVEKKKAQKKLKREKEKVKKEENKVKRKEEVEKERFLKLSDREKRALAAERRILSQDGQVTSRCFLCASDMAGKVPFEYLGNRFCSIECLKSHRLKNSLQLS